MNEQAMDTEQWDVVVIGGGPSGSSTAAALARDGRRVTVLERTESFPRYKVGESIVPYTYRIAEKIGVLDKLCAAGFVHKQGFNFLSKSGKLTHPYFFRQSIKDPLAITWSVERDVFDQLLLDHAAESGAVVRRGARVERVLRDGEQVVGVEWVDREGQRREARAAVVVDATGRGALMGREFGLRERDPKLDQLAVWRYMKGAYKQPGESAGNIVVALLAPRGWFWWIPMANDVTSIGVVTSASHLRSIGATPAEQFDRALQLNPALVEWTRAGTWETEYFVTGDYSYTCSRKAGDGWVAVGDAGGFIDPVFSPGVFLAMSSAVLAADAITAALDADDCSASAFADYEQLYRRGESTFRIFLDAFYDPLFSAGRFFKDHPHWISEWGRVLQGDVYGDNRKFNDFIMTYRFKLAWEAGVEPDIYLPPGWREDHLAPEAERVRDPFEFATSWRDRECLQTSVA